MTEQDYNNCVDSHADGLYRFIVKNIKNTEDARDIVQSAFEKLWIHRTEVAGLKAKSYLYTVAYHQMIDVIRKEKRNPTTSEYDEVDLVSYQTSSELKQQLLRAIHQLNHTQKSLILLKDYEGYSYQEIGEIMNLSESQVKVYLHRARLFLKSKLLQLEKVKA
ncbi:MAG: RNA polymerase sigma factor [Sediminibacterium sp.]|jgi:RNA polymerase sigma factor (sigma-70 family)